MFTETPVTQFDTETFSLGGDLPVRRIGLGTMRLTDATGDGTLLGAEIWRQSTDSETAVSLLRGAVDRGVQLIDTADAYALGASEELVSRALYPYDGVTIATKVGMLRPSPKEWVPLGHPDYLRQQVELSLRRLRVERIDLLQLHRVDPDYPLADQVGALAELRAQGKIRHIGLSEVSVTQLDDALATAPIAAVQNLYNLQAREHDGVVDYAAEKGIAFLPFFPLAVGSLSQAGGALAEVGRALGVTASQVALAWLLHRGAHIAPIPGTRSLAHLEENLAAAHVQLSVEQLAVIESASRETDADS